MTQQEALTEAQKRWGKNAWATKATAGYYQVGDLIRYNRQRALGGGPSWEAAFADADSNERAK